MDWQSNVGWRLELHSKDSPVHFNGGGTCRREGGEMIALAGEEEEEE